MKASTAKVVPVVDVVLVPRSQVEQLAEAITDLERSLAVLIAIKKAQQGKP